VGYAFFVGAALLAAALVLVAIAIFWHARRKRPVDLSAVLGGLKALETAQERSERAMRDDFAKNREEGSAHSRNLREEVGSELKGLGDSNERRFESLRETVERKLAQIQEDNAKGLEAMRLTVSEKLEGTLERRLGQSFKLVGEQLEQVQKGLGEMQSLASGVGDLKRVLTNVKTRGTWAEMRLGNLLEQMLSPEQYEANVVTKEGSGERVEFAIRLPGRDQLEGEVVWLPIDSKFPMAAYERLVEASEKGDAGAVDVAGREMETRIKDEAKKISDKYLNPPKTTDFGIMFLGCEGLYAEVVRRPGLAALLQQDYRVNVTGPSTLAALLNSLQMGFRTLAIQKRSSEVWAVLGAVKAEFGKFGEVLGKVKKKLDEASSTIDKASVRTRVIERRLKKVGELPAQEASALLGKGEEEEPETREGGVEGPTRALPEAGEPSDG